MVQCAEKNLVLIVGRNAAEDMQPRQEVLIYQDLLSPPPSYRRCLPRTLSVFLSALCRYHASSASAELPVAKTATAFTDMWKNTPVQMEPERSYTQHRTNAAGTY